MENVDTKASPLWQRTALVLFGAAIVAAAYYILAALYGGSGHVAPPQPDSLMYMQYAKSMAEGTPYEFIPGEGRSTGSTSHLYPFLLSILYRAGARGDALLNAGFLLNAMFYVLFVFFCWLAAKKIAPSVAGVAILLILLNGYLSSTALGMSDMGLFMTVSAGTFAAALGGNAILTAVGLVLCGWSRPEGLFMSLTLIAVGVVMGALREKKGWRFAIAGLVGLLASLGVFAWNRALTGSWQFQSVAHKGYMANFPFWGAVAHTIRDFGTLVREVLFNVADNARQSYSLPLLGGLLSIIGIASVDWKSGKTRIQEAWWLLTALGGLVLVASSAWQFINLDRYLGWIFPVWILYAASGLRRVSDGFSSRPAVFGVLAALLIGYELATLPFFLGMYGSSCMFAESRVDFCKSIHQQMPPTQILGSISGTGLRYVMPGRRMIHVSGITTPALAGARDVLCNLETLKHRPDLRFDRWLITTAQKTSPLTTGLLGADLVADFDALGDPSALVLCEANWESMRDVAKPILPAISKAVSGMSLVQRVDVGYPEDEKRSRYRIVTRLPQTQILLFATTRRLGDRTVTEVGQPVLGADSFTLKVKPNKPLRIVMRTALDAVAPITRVDMQLRDEGFHFRSPLRLRPMVNDRLAEDILVNVDCAENEMTEVVFDIPAKHVDAENVTITLGGDHIAFAYWVYQ